MSNTVIKVPPTVTSITINGNVINTSTGEGTVDSNDWSNAVRQSAGMQGPCIMIGLSKPPATNP